MESLSISQGAKKVLAEGSVDNLYLKEVSTSRGVQYKIFNTNWPKLRRFAHFVEMIFCSSKYFHGQSSISKLTNSFKKARIIKKDSNFGWKKTMNKAITVEKLQRGNRKLGYFYKGFAKMRKKGLSPKALESNYWAEALNKKHEGTHVSMIKFNGWNTSKTDLSFEEWLDSDECQKFIIDSDLASIDNSGGAGVSYLGEVERSEYKISFRCDEDGKVCLLRNGAMYTTTEERTEASGKGTAIIVVDVNEDIYAGTHEISKFHHSSFLSGGSICFAGEITTDDKGQVTRISNKSGHYAPGDDQLSYFIRRLATQGADLSQIQVRKLSADGGEVSFQDADDYLSA